MFLLFERKKINMKENKTNYWQNEVNYTSRKSFQHYWLSKEKKDSNKANVSPPCEPPCETGCGACDD